MKTRIILFLFCLCTLNAAGQGITRQKCAICGKLKVQCPGHEKTCTSCGKVISKCPYNGNHPVEKKCPTCGKPLSKCPGHEAKCRSCGKVISKCPYKGKHPAQKEKGYYVAIGCNVSPVTISYDDEDYHELSGAAVVYFETGVHRVKVKADGYEDYSTEINVGKSSTLFFFDLKPMDAKTLYSKGKGYYNKKDYAEAVKWYRKAADQGYAVAQCDLGVCYCNGLGVTQDYTEAVEWFRKAAEQGDAVAQYNLGVCYQYGDGFAKDKAEAMKWYRKAAEQGYENAKKKLQELDNAVITVTGTVLDESNDPIIGASIMLSGTKTGTVTDFDGKFKFNVSPNDILEIQYVGYKSEKIRITNETKNIIVKLRSSSNKPSISTPSGYENGYGYVDLGLSVKWATTNVGASSPTEYGGYYAWGETSTKSVYSEDTYFDSDSNKYAKNKKTTLDLSDDAAHANWGGSWRMPTRAEQDELREKCTWTWTTQNGVKGYKVSSKLNSNSIFLPAAGDCGVGSLRIVGSHGYYWSSSLNVYSPSYAYNLYLGSDYVRCTIECRSCGLSVRAVCP